MALLTLHTLPSPVLRQKAQPVASVDKRIVKLMHDMLETMYKSHGIGLAANQVGVLERVITLDLSEERDGKNALLLANPEIVWSDPDHFFTYKEGCLSVPQNYADVLRPQKIRVRYLDHHNKTQELEAEDLFSQCLQHEIDHLNGVLFIDHLSTLKRNMILRKIEKARRDGDLEGSLL